MREPSRIFLVNEIFAVKLLDEVICADALFLR